MKSTPPPESSNPGWDIDELDGDPLCSEEWLAVCQRAMERADKIRSTK